VAAFLGDASCSRVGAFSQKKDTGFNSSCFAVALNRTAKFPDEIDRWPVKMVVEFDPVALKRSFQSLAMRTLAENSGKA